MNTRLTIWLLLMVSTSSVTVSQQDTVKPRPQNPSPMVDFTRRHERIVQKEYPGIVYEIPDLFSKPLQLHVPRKSIKAKSFDVLIHFNGAPYVTQFAASHYRGNLIAGTLSVGSGSTVYNNAFQDSTKFKAMLDSVVSCTQRKLMRTIKIKRVILSGFSAGYASIRRIISSEWNYARVDAILLLDGIHASYVPESTVLANGGRIDSTGLMAYARFSEDASRKNSRKRFLITHSEIFPGTYVSTTEATDYLLSGLSMKRTPVLKWGPLGMQQISQSRKNHFAVLGFAGNTARDHVDHVQSLFWFLRELMKL